MTFIHGNKGILFTSIVIMASFIFVLTSKVNEKKVELIKNKKEYEVICEKIKFNNENILIGEDL